MLHASLSHSSASQGASQVQEVEGMVQDLALQVGEPKQKVQYHKQLKAPVNGRYNLETNYRINYNKTSSYIYIYICHLVEKRRNRFFYSVKKGKK